MKTFVAQKNSISIGAAVLLMVLMLVYGVGAGNETEGGTIKIYDASTDKMKVVDKVSKSEEEWRAMLTAQQFDVTRKHATEQPFTGELLKNKKEGIYQCVGCGTDLFLSKVKYDSKTGWPSFWKPVAEENIGTTDDNSLFMRRTEVHCPRCGAHLGHVFDDGPAPTYKRYCINSAALKFQSMKDSDGDR